MRVTAVRDDDARTLTLTLQMPLGANPDAAADAAWNAVYEQLGATPAVPAEDAVPA